MNKVILHIDFDSYFASCEQQFQPILRGKPVGVTATNGRTCIIAASREAKRKGVKSPSNIYAAQKICPDLKLVSAQFEKYWEISKKFIAIGKDYSPYVEVFSLDEMFVDITHTRHLFGGTEGIIRRIKQRLRDEIGEYITASIGISHNKLLAKLASGWNKPDGVMYIDESNLDAVYKEAELTDICGIGTRIAARLNMLGIFTLMHLRRTPLHSLIAEFGVVEGKFLKNVGLGIDESRVIPYTEEQPVKSVGRQHCLAANQYDMREVLQEAYELAEEIGIKLRRLRMKTRHVGMSLYGSIAVNVHKTYSNYFDTGKEIFDTCYRMIDTPASGFYTLPEEFRYVRRIGVWASDLKPADTITLSLFPDDLKREKIQRVRDMINEKFGDHTIRNGFLLYAKKLKTIPNGFGPDTFERTRLARFGL